MIKVIQMKWNGLAQWMLKIVLLSSLLISTIKLINKKNN